jgi:hypothetical protein
MDSLKVHLEFIHLSQNRLSEVVGSYGVCNFSKFAASLR